VADLTSAIWRKSTRSGNGGNCVEVATNLHVTTKIVPIRDSKDPTGPVLIFTPEEWKAFVSGIRSGEFDL
jgi:hypothetical protein